METKIVLTLCRLTFTVTSAYIVAIIIALINGNTSLFDGVTLHTILVGVSPIAMIVAGSFILAYEKYGGDIK